MTIEIIPLGEIDEFILDYLKDNLGNVFSEEVYLGKSQAVPEYAFDKKRKQYFYILDWTKQQHLTYKKNFFQN